MTTSSASTSSSTEQRLSPYALTSIAKTCTNLVSAVANTAFVRCCHRQHSTPIPEYTLLSQEQISLSRTAAAGSPIRAWGRLQRLLPSKPYPLSPKADIAGALVSRGPHRALSGAPLRALRPPLI